jgi:hypothetical protein
MASVNVVVGHNMAKIGVDDQPAYQLPNSKGRSELYSPGRPKIYPWPLAMGESFKIDVKPGETYKKVQCRLVRCAEHRRIKYGELYSTKRIFNAVKVKRVG